MIWGRVAKTAAIFARKPGTTSDVRNDGYVSRNQYLSVSISDLKQLPRKVHIPYLHFISESSDVGKEKWVASKDDRIVGRR
jgi:hypothetical protein